jgi:two-component system NtrC family sensor kinase
MPALSRWIALVLALPFFLASPFALTATADNHLDSPSPTAAVTISESTQRLSLGEHLLLLEDPTGTLGIDDIKTPEQQQRFTRSSQHEPNLGITSSAWWAQIVVRNHSTRTFWYLDQNDAMTRYIDVWASINGGEPIYFPGGSMRPVAARNADSLTHAFKLSLPEGSTTRLYVRLQSDYVATFKLSLLSPESFLLSQRHLNLLHGLYLGIMLSLVAYNAFLYIALKELAYLHYTSLMIAFTVFNTALNGQLPYYLLPQSPALANALMVFSLSMVPALFALFGERFLNDQSDTAKMTRHISAAAGVLSLAVAGFSLTLWTWLSTLNSTFVLILFTALLVNRIRKGDRAALYFMIGVGWFIAGGGALILGLLAVLPFEGLITEMGAGMTAIFLSLALAQRMRNLKDAKDAAHDQLQAKHAQLEATHKQLLQQEKMAQLGLLSAGVAHEINNPNHFLSISAQTIEHRLKDLQTFINDLMGDEADEDIRQEFTNRFSALFNQLDLVKDGSARITGIVKSMRSASRNDSGEARVFDPTEGLLATVQLVQSSWKQRVQFDTSAVSAHADVTGHASQLNQVFTNLMVNACHAIEEKQNASGDSTPGRVGLGTRLSGEYIAIDIEDSGCGMPEHVRQRLFEPFFTTKGADRGTGLGMGICRAIIDEHKGRMEVESTAGVGTCFTIYLPLHTATP